MFGVDRTHLNSCLQSKSYEDFIYTIINQTPQLHTMDTLVYTPKILRPPKKMQDVDVAERKVFRKKRREGYMTLKEWWFSKMLKTNDTFLERMVLFWHNHFTSSLKKVKQPSLNVSTKSTF